ncbi:hypothetical protein CF455_23775 [Salmonella enterica]|nr:hypothetical protein [Salmonella enterica]
MSRFKAVELNMDNPDITIKTKPWGVYDSETNTLRAQIFNYDHEVDKAVQTLEDMDYLEKETKNVLPHSENPDYKI